MVLLAAAAPAQTIRVLSSGAPPRNRVDRAKTEDAGDFVLVQGRRVPLLRAVEETAIEYRKTVTPAQGLPMISALPQFRTLSHFETFTPKNLEVLHYPPARGRVKVQDLNRVLSIQPGVAHAYPVLVNPSDGVRMIATDEILVCLAPGLEMGGMTGYLNMLPAAVVGQEPAADLNVWRIRLLRPELTDALAASRTIAQWPGVQWSEPNFVRQIGFQFTPNDPLFARQQSLANTGQSGGVSGADMKATAAWDVTQGSANVIIAIIDEAVDPKHPDLNIAPGGYDFLNNAPNPVPTETDGHGTGTAGLAAAIGNNGQLMSGLAPRCRILSVKVAGPNGFTDDASIGNAIRYAGDHADVLNNSWGGGSESTFIDTAIDYATKSGRSGKGCPVFFATGNSASGWLNGGGRNRISLEGWRGNFYFGLEYIKDNTMSDGADGGEIDNACMLAADGYTQLWRENFEGTFPPAGWALITTGAGAGKWFRTASGILTGTGGKYSAHTGAIKDGQSTILRSRLQNLTADVIFCYSVSVSSEYLFDRLRFDVMDANGAIVGYTYGDSGIPQVDVAPIYPASYAASIAVGAATDCDFRADYSQYGPKLDFLASSNGGWNDVLTLDPVGAVGWEPGNIKYEFGGTSGACAYASGMAALVLSRNPGLSAAQVRTVMRKSCDKIGPLAYAGGDAGAGGRNDQYGYGRLNALKAVQNAGTSPAALTVTPVAGLVSTANLGGPFNPTSMVYTIRNTGSLPLNWSVAKTKTWTTLSKTGGTNLAPNATDTVTVRYNSGATILLPGIQVDTLTFTNLISNQSTLRTVKLTIGPAALVPVWAHTTAAAAWPARDAAGTAVFNNRLWIAGGAGAAARLRDVWSSADGAAWVRATATANWPARSGAVMAVFGGKIWLLGGTSGPSNFNDVWNSADGITWTRVSAAAPWSPRTDHTVTVFNNRIWVIGGQGTAGRFADVWSSADGINWTQATAAAKWGARSGHGSFVFANKLWVVGGVNAAGIYQNDTWYSSDGATWFLTTSAPVPWGARAFHACTAFRGKIWVFGGVNSGGTLSDGWYSADGANWTRLPGVPPWGARSGMAAVPFLNRLYIIGGTDATGKRNDIWQMN